MTEQEIKEMFERMFKKESKALMAKKNRKRKNKLLRSRYEEELRLKGLPAPLTPEDRELYYEAE
jgi:hypothetical protein